MGCLQVVNGCSVCGDTNSGLMDVCFGVKRSIKGVIMIFVLHC